MGKYFTKAMSETLKSIGYQWLIEATLIILGCGIAGE